MEDRKFEESEWELINPKNIHMTLNNSDGLHWSFSVGIKLPDGYIRGMPIGNFIQGLEGSIEFETNPNDKEYSYKIIMSGKTILFFRRKRSSK
jgi:hypothetical protein